MTISDLADERLRRRLERLRDAMRARKTLPSSDRPTMARNLGLLVEELWPHESPTKIAARLLESAFSVDGAHSKIRNRRRYMRFASDPLPTSEVDVGEYAAKECDFWPVAEAIAREHGGGNERRWTILARMVAGTSFGDPISAPVLSSASPDRQLQLELAAIAERIGGFAGLDEYFSALGTSPTHLHEVNDFPLPTDIPFETSRYSPSQLARWQQNGKPLRFSASKTRYDFASLEGYGDSFGAAAYAAVPTVFLGWAYVPFPVLSVDLPDFGSFRRASQLIKATWEGQGERLWEAVRTRFGGGPGAVGFGDEDCGGEPAKDDPWSLLSHNWETQEWEMNDLSNFWASEGVEDNTPQNSSGRAWRRLYAKGAVWLSLMPTADGLRFGLGGGPDLENFSDYVSDVGEEGECATFSVELPIPGQTQSRSARRASFFWRAGLHLYRWCPADTFHVYENRVGIPAEQMAVPIGDQRTNLLVHGQLSPLADGGYVGGWKDIAAGPIGFKPAFATYTEQWAPAPSDTLAGTLLRHFAYHEGDDGLEASLLRQAKVRVQSLGAFVARGNATYQEAVRNRRSRPPI